MRKEIIHEISEENIRSLRQYNTELSNSSITIVGVDDIRYIWNHQVVVVPPGCTIHPDIPVIDSLFSRKAEDKKRLRNVPLVVGIDGRLRGPTNLRRILYKRDSEKTTIYLHYPVSAKSGEEVIIKIVGVNTQIIEIVSEGSHGSDIPVVMYLPKKIKSSHEKR